MRSCVTEMLNPQAFPAEKGGQLPLEFSIFYLQHPYFELARPSSFLYFTRDIKSIKACVRTLLHAPMDSACCILSRKTVRQGSMRRPKAPLLFFTPPNICAFYPSSPLPAFSEAFLSSMDRPALLPSRSRLNRKRTPRRPIPWTSPSPPPPSTASGLSLRRHAPPLSHLHAH